MDIDFPFTENLEFAINVGCRNNCKKYCPQDAVLANYKGERLMSFEVFQKILSSVPSRVGVIFAGVAEPFDNPDVVRMVELAASSGHKVGFFTTLVGARPEQIIALSKVKFERFKLHMPDSSVLRLPFDVVRAECEHLVWSLISVAEAMSMNDWFIYTNGREYLSRGEKRIKDRRVGYCLKLHVPQLFVYPNGDVYLCCTDWALEHKIGNLLTQSYGEVREAFFRGQPYNLCRFCPSNISLKRFYGRQLAVYVKNMLRKVGFI